MFCDEAGGRCKLLALRKCLLSLLVQFLEYRHVGNAGPSVEDRLSDESGVCH